MKVWLGKNHCAAGTKEKAEAQPKTSPEWKQHGGEIVIDNQPNRGYRFRLLWPSLEDENRSAGRKTMRSTDPEIDEGFTEDSQR